MVGMRLVKEGRADAFASAGNSGAVMAAALFGLGRIPGVERPALGSIYPAAPAPCLLMDIGANADCKPEYLVQFAIMGDAYARLMFGIAQAQGRHRLERRGGRQGQHAGPRDVSRCCRPAG